VAYLYYKTPNFFACGGPEIFPENLFLHEPDGPHRSPSREQTLSANGVFLMDSVVIFFITPVLQAPKRHTEHKVRAWGGSPELGLISYPGYLAIRVKIRVERCGQGSVRGGAQHLLDLSYCCRV
jgi:hypothetical protein